MIDIILVNVPPNIKTTRQLNKSLFRGKVCEKFLSFRDVLCKEAATY